MHFETIAYRWAAFRQDRLSRKYTKLSFDEVAVLMEPYVEGLTAQGQIVCLADGLVDRECADCSHVFSLGDKYWGEGPWEWSCLACEGRWVLGCLLEGVLFHLPGEERENELYDNFMNSDGDLISLAMALSAAGKVDRMKAADPKVTETPYLPKISVVGTEFTPSRKITEAEILTGGWEDAGSKKTVYGVLPKDEKLFSESCDRHREYVSQEGVALSEQDSQPVAAVRAVADFLVVWLQAVGFTREELPASYTLLESRTFDLLRLAAVRGEL